MVPFWLMIVCYILLIHTVTAEQNTDCQNHWLHINATCTNNDNYYSPTIAIQTLSGYDTSNFHSYSKISLSIRANHDVIITPHCISMDIDINPTIINYLSHQWLLNKVEWPSYHSQGEIITFSATKTESQYITFSRACILSPNTSNGLILLFNTNFDAYTVETHGTQNCDRQNGITMYDKLYNDYDINDENKNCFPMQSENRWNLNLLNATKNDEPALYASERKAQNAPSSLVIALIVIIVIVNIASCGLLWYFNQKQLNKNIKEMTRNLQGIALENEEHENSNSNESNMRKTKDHTTTVISSLSETKYIASIHNDKKRIEDNNNILPVLAAHDTTNHTAHTNTTHTNNTNNTIIWVNKSYFDSSNMDEDNLFSNMSDDNTVIVNDAERPQHDEEEEDDHNLDDIDIDIAIAHCVQNENANQSKLNKLRILLPVKGSKSHSYTYNMNANGTMRSPSNTATTLTAIPFSDDDWKTPETLTTTLGNTPHLLYIMDEINENEETPIVKPSLQFGFRSNESAKSSISVASSIRLPAYHPNKIKIMNDNQHIPYNKQFIIAVTPPIMPNNKPSLHAIGFSSNNSSTSNKSGNSLALPVTTRHPTNVHK